MSRKLYSVDTTNSIFQINTMTNNINDKSSSSSLVTITSTNESIPETVTLPSDQIESTVNKIKGNDGVFNTVTIAHNLVAINENINDNFNIDTTESYMRQQIGLVFPYRQSIDTNYGFMGFINNNNDVVNMYTEFIFFKKSNISSLQEIISD